MYEREWCSENVILEWYKSREDSSADSKVLELVHDDKVVELIEWLWDVDEVSKSDEAAMEAGQMHDEDVGSSMLWQPKIVYLHTLGLLDIEQK